MSQLQPGLEHNPLLVQEGLPLFDRITPEHIVPAVRKILADAEKQFAELENTISTDLGGPDRTAGGTRYSFRIRLATGLSFHGC